MTQMLPLEVEVGDPGALLHLARVHTVDVLADSTRDLANPEHLANAEAWLEGAALCQERQHGSGTLLSSRSQIVKLLLLQLTRCCRQAEAVCQLLRSLAQQVILTPRTCLSLVTAARSTGLLGLHRAAAAVAQQNFPFCALENPEGLAATSEALLRHLLQCADREARPWFLSVGATFVSLPRLSWHAPCMVIEWSHLLG